jgi:hypothetical protein
MVTIASHIEKSNAAEHIKRYAYGLTLPNKKRTCSDLARSMHIGHDSIQRDLNKVAECPEEARSYLSQHAIEQLSQLLHRYLAMDNTLLIKEYAEKIEGVSLQHSGSDHKLQSGINVTCFILTDGEKIIPLDGFTWRKGDRSKVAQATDLAIQLAQQFNVEAVLADGAYASTEALQRFQIVGVHCVMRFHANRVISAPGFDGEYPVKEHPAFHFKKNKRCIVRDVIWRGLSLRVIALKIPRKYQQYRIIYLVTTAPFEHAHQYARIYKIRWKIEVFFRTTKQKFGLGDCQARTLRQQIAHCLTVFIAYTFT